LMAAASGARGFLKRTEQLFAIEAERGDEPGEERAEGDGAKGEEEYATIDADGFNSVHVGLEVCKGVQRSPGERDADCTGRCGDENALGEPLAEKAKASSAESG